MIDMLLKCVQQNSQEELLINCWLLRYMEVELAKHWPLLQRFNGKNASFEDLGPIGSAPVLIHRDQLARIVPGWCDLSVAIKSDPVADTTLGWVQVTFLILSSLPVQILCLACIAV